jgi:hypothetical protein
MNFKLSKEQCKYLKKDNITKFPNKSIKLITENKKKYLIVNLYKMNGNNNCTQIDFLDVLIDFKKAGWNFLGSMYPYIYFYKNKNIFNLFT